MMSNEFILVTGANGSIGASIVDRLLANDYQVVSTDLHDLKDQRKRALMVYQGYLGHICLDLSKVSLQSWNADDLIHQLTTLSRGGSIKGIIHNAAHQVVAPFHDLKLFDWSQTFAVNLFAPVLLTQSLLPILTSVKGSIINIGSIHATLTKPGFSAYASSKSALAGLTRALAVELGGLIRVNAIEPAAISTPMLEAGFSEKQELRQSLSRYHPTGFIGSPDDVARAVLFLLDDSNSFLNGCILPLGGGIHSRLHDPV